MSAQYETARYIAQSTGHDAYPGVLVTDKTKLTASGRYKLSRMFRRSHALKLVAMLEMEADEALFLALRSMGMYNLPHKDRYKK